MSLYRRSGLMGLSLCWAACGGIVWAAQVPTASNRMNQVSGSPTDLVDIRNQIDGEVEIILRRAQLMSTKVDVLRVAIGDSAIVDVAQLDPREMQLIGKELGTTTMTLWLGNPGMAQQILTYLVTVTPDPGLQHLRKTQYRELEAMLNELFPNSKVQLIPVADKLVVRGQARDAQEATQIMAVVRGQAVDTADAPGQMTGFVNQGQAAEVYPGAGIPASNIINMLRVPGEQQVLLKARVAELSRTALRELGVDFSVAEGKFFFSSILAGRSNIVATFDDGDVKTLFHALETRGILKVLAEPNLVTLSGHTASFIAGGRFAVPTVVGVGGAEAATTTFQGFGTQLTFTPTVLDKDRIRLTVAPEFSSVNTALSVNGIPGLNTRAAFTTVDIREGQVLAIAGLLSDREVGTNTRVPLLGRIPVLGAAFSSKSVSRDENELIVLVSPEIVHPMNPEEAPTVLPGTDVTEPTDCDLYLRGRLEGNPGENFRSTAWPEYRMRAEDAKHRTKHGVVVSPSMYGESQIATSQVPPAPPTPSTGRNLPVTGAQSRVARMRATVPPSQETSKTSKAPQVQEGPVARQTTVHQTSGYQPINAGQDQQRAHENRFMAGPRGFSD